MSALPDDALQAEAMREMLAKQVDAAGSRAAWAQAHRVPVRAVGMTLDRERSFQPCVAIALGFQPVEIYVPLKRRSEAAAAELNQARDAARAHFRTAGERA